MDKFSKIAALVAKADAIAARADVVGNSRGIGYKIQFDNRSEFFTSIRDLQAWVHDIKRKDPSVIGKIAKIWKGEIPQGSEYISYSGAPTQIKVTADY